MKLFSRILMSGLLLIPLINFTACNGNKGGDYLKTKEDSITFVKNVLTIYPELCDRGGSQNQVKKADTINLPENLDKKDKLVDGFYYKYFKAGNYLISKNPSAERGFMIASMASGPIDLATANRYVQNYKDWVNNGAQEYTKQFSYVIDSAEIGALTRIIGYHGIRVYMGMRVANNADSETVVLTAYQADSSDLYIPNAKGPMVIDKVTPCPWDCPCLIGDASSKAMLGRQAKDPIIRHQ